MKSLEIKGIIRETTGKKDTKKLRKENNIPSVLYGGKENIHFTAHHNSFLKLVYSPNVYTLKLNIDGKQYNAVLHDIQFHPVSDKILHIDFLEIFEDKKVIIQIPVKLIGFAKGIQEGGKQRLEIRKLKVCAFLKDLPDTLDINVENLSLGESIKVGELSFDNLELMDSKNEDVVSVKITRVAKGMEILEEVKEVEEEEVEGEEVEGEEKEKVEGKEGEEKEAKEGDKTSAKGGFVSDGKDEKSKGTEKSKKKEGK